MWEGFQKSKVINSRRWDKGNLRSIHANNQSE